MKVLRLIFLVTLVFGVVCRALGQTPEEIINRVITEGGEQTWSDAPIQRAIDELSTFDAKTVSSALYLAFKRPESVTNQRPTIFKIIRKIPNFDVNEWVYRLENETDPILLCYATSAATSSTKANSTKLKALLVKMLNDKRIGQKLHGEARAYSSRGLRVCDWSLNLLWSLEPEKDRPLDYPWGASISVRKRDQRIVEYAKQFHLELSPQPAETKAQPSATAP
jgi:hypothetical protein